MSDPPTLHIRQEAAPGGSHRIRLTLKRPGQFDLEGEATIEFGLSDEEQGDLRWYLEEYLQGTDPTHMVTAGQVEALMRTRGEELYTKVLAANLGAQAIWFAVREQLAGLRIQIATGIAEAAAIPWELMRDPQSGSAIALRVQSFVRVQSNPNISFVIPPPAAEGRIRLLYVVCRPRGTDDVSLRAVANRLLQGLGPDLARFEITALRPPTFEQLQETLRDAKSNGRPFHIVHFDGHGVYADLRETRWKEWLKTLGALTLGGPAAGPHGYLLFEHPTGRDNVRPVGGEELGKLLHDTGVPVLVLNACQSAMHEAAGQPPAAAEKPANPPAGESAAPAGAVAGDAVHAAVAAAGAAAFGSLAQAVVDQGIPAVLGMRYKVYVVTAAQAIGRLYAALAKGRTFGEAASEARKDLASNPERWLDLEPRPLQDWFVPVIYEAGPIPLLPDQASAGLGLDDRPEPDPVQRDPTLLRYVPDTGFIGRDETLLLLDRAFDRHPVVLLHAYAGQGKTAAAVEFSRWYARTGGLGPQPAVLFTSFENHTDLTTVLNQAGQLFKPLLQANNIEWGALNDLADRRNLVVQLLRLVPVLWIWDNVEPVAGFPAGTESQWTAAEQAELAGFLKLIREDRGTRAKLLLTSRRDERKWLGATPHRVAMPRMSRADAARLALVIGEERGLAPNDVAGWGPLLDYCAGNPLTLRILAGQAVRGGLRRKGQIEAFIQALRDGEARIQDVDATQGRDKSLAASLDYGFRNAFSGEEQAVIALLHLFQGTVFMQVLRAMGNQGEHSLPEVQGRTDADLVALLERARDIGLLTQLNTQYYTIHPALPWYLRRLFAAHYDGAGGRSTAEAALRAWVEAIGELGDYYHDRFGEGNREVIDPLALEEANLLHARRAARREGWWDPLTSAMQGLHVLYEYGGRTAEWARLVAESAPDYCTADDMPVPGREEGYTLVMGYRIRLAQDHERDLSRAAALQEKLVVLHREQAAAALALPPDAALDALQRHRIRSLGVSVETLGHILREQGSPDCVPQYEEAIRHYRRTGDTVVEAIALYNLGTAYKDLPAIRDLDAAEAAYRRSLDGWAKDDLLNRSKTYQAIGMVYHARFIEASKRGEPEEVVLKHVQTAQGQYLQALALCPPNALTDLGPMHAQIATFYAVLLMLEPAREHFEKAAQCFERAGDHHGAGKVRHDMAFMYLQAAGREKSPGRDLLRRAEAYAAASLRDFQHYGGRAAADEAIAQRLIDHIARELGEAG